MVQNKTTDWSGLLYKANLSVVGHIFYLSRILTQIWHISLVDAASKTHMSPRFWIVWVIWQCSCPAHCLALCFGLCQIPWTFQSVAAIQIITLNFSGYRLICMDVQGFRVDLIPSKYQEQTITQQISGTCIRDWHLGTFNLNKIGPNFAEAKCTQSKHW